MFFAQLIDRLGHIPGVRNVGATSGLPLMDGGLPDGGFLLLAPHEVPPTLEGLLAMFDQKERRGGADFCVATAGYFQVLGIPVVRGPIFGERDTANAPHAAVMSQCLAPDRLPWP